MHIREAATQSGVSAPAIRYYEQLGLLGAVNRTAAGYRVFSERDVHLLIFLRKARELGFTLRECRELLDLIAAPGRRSKNNVKRTRDLAASRLAGIKQQIAELERMRDLVQLHFDSLGSEQTDCPVSNDL